MALLAEDVWEFVGLRLEIFTILSSPSSKNPPKTEEKDYWTAYLIVSKEFPERIGSVHTVFAYRSDARAYMKKVAGGKVVKVKIYPENL